MVSPVHRLVTIMTESSGYSTSFIVLSFILILLSFKYTHIVHHVLIIIDTIIS
jgi:hypothetical protein